MYYVYFIKLQIPVFLKLSLWAKLQFGQNEFGHKKLGQSEFGQSEFGYNEFVHYEFNHHELGGNLVSVDIRKQTYYNFIAVCRVITYYFESFDRSVS